LIQRNADVAGVDARLSEAAAKGQRLEVILVLRGKVRRGTGKGGWRMRLENGRVITFRGDTVVAVTPLPTRARE
jgi:hypothetical protein